MRTHHKIRIFLFMLAFGLASVKFLPFLYDKWTEIYVDLPKIESDSAIFVFPKQILTQDILRKQLLVEQKRDLSLYEKGKTISNFCPESFTEKDCNKIIIKARQFIIKNFKEKRLIYIKYKWSGVDSGVDNHIYIEPNETGKWRIVLIRKYFGPGYELENDGKNNWDAIEISTVKLKRATEDDYQFDLGTNYLAFLDENGGEVFGL